MPFFRLRILVGFSERLIEYSFQKKTPPKITLIIPIYSLEPIMTVSAYFVEDLIAFYR
jgi:exonuclease I